MNLMLAARVNHNAHRHADLNVRDVGIDNVSRDFWTFGERNHGDNVGKLVLKVWMIGFVENDKSTDCSPP